MVNVTRDIKPAPEEFLAAIYKILETVSDPEIPVISIIDLGILRNVKIKDQQLVVEITPTYSGCPAMDMIAVNVRIALAEHGYKNVIIETRLSPSWTTEWMTDKGKAQLKAYGIAPPNPMHSVCTPDAFQEEEVVQCPQCNSYHTRLVSRFGSTACKSLYQCDECKEPFDYFKCH